MPMKAQRPTPNAQSPRGGLPRHARTALVVWALGVGLWALGLGLWATPVSAQARPRASQAAKEDVNRRQSDGSTPLQWAVYEGNVAEVKRLLRAGADVTIANNYGVTPMSLAAEVGNPEMLKVLLEVG